MLPVSQICLIASTSAQQQKVQLGTYQRLNKYLFRGEFTACETRTCCRDHYVRIPSQQTGRRAIQGPSAARPGAPVGELTASSLSYH
jgi:hypothetical protein